MLSRSSWLHLRIPFSYFLLPVFLFALAISSDASVKAELWTFAIIHLLLYPASNGYNSYFDKDEKSIGGLKNPPPVNKGLYHLALLFDILAIILGLLTINLTFAVMLLIYGIVSKAYSHPDVRLKKMPIVGWLVAGFFQGFFTLLMCYIGINNCTLQSIWRPEIVVPGILCSIMLWASYPMTQIYQHEEDGRRGDETLSRKLGILGTFYFVAAIFGLVSVCFTLYFVTFYNWQLAIAYLLALFPAVAFFSHWFIKTYRSREAADYGHTMWLNFISATTLNAFFLFMTWAF
ncbi:MAG: UbiA family prenyltransferase [Chryseolinea sp.]